MTDAIQSDRNSGSANGAHAETERLRVLGATTGILIISAMSLLVENRASPAGHLTDGRTRRPSLH